MSLSHLNTLTHAFCLPGMHPLLHLLDSSHSPSLNLNVTSSERPSLLPNQSGLPAVLTRSVCCNSQPGVYLSAYLLIACHPE